MSLLWEVRPRQKRKKKELGGLPVNQEKGRNKRHLGRKLVSPARGRKDLAQKQSWGGIRLREGN